MLKKHWRVQKAKQRNIPAVTNTLGTEKEKGNVLKRDITEILK